MTFFAINNYLLENKVYAARRRHRLTHSIGKSMVNSVYQLFRDGVLRFIALALGWLSGWGRPSDRYARECAGCGLESHRCTVGLMQN